MSACLTDPNQLPERQSLTIAYESRTREVGSPAQGKKGQPGYKPRTIALGTLSIVTQVRTLTRYWDLSTPVAAQLIASKDTNNSSGRQVKNPSDTTSTLSGTWYRESISESSRGNGISRVTEVLTHRKDLTSNIILVGSPS